MKIYKFYRKKTSQQFLKSCANCKRRFLKPNALIVLPTTMFFFNGYTKESAIIAGLPASLIQVVLREAVVKWLRLRLSIERSDVRGTP